ncbi:MAG: hypothetical protein LGR52_11750, partial [Candidatus Thiosymbion ectosymbiont of Robbea hypermnestra]|nr:hypothetical protein [Candidatus Thiosymbion ectosymbiont of Robbea hypermnestra]
NLENPVNPVLLADCDARADKTVTCFALVVSGIRRIYPGTTKLQHYPRKIRGNEVPASRNRDKGE